MKEDILKQVNGEDAADFRFHIMCVNVWMEMDSTKDIVPCEQLSTLSSCDWFLIFSILFIIVLGEIGLVEMSLKHGIIRKYNQLIHPGVIPTGNFLVLKVRTNFPTNILWSFSSIICANFQYQEVLKMGVGTLSLANNRFRFSGYRADIKINGEKYHGVFLNNSELVDDYKDSNFNLCH